MNGWNHDLPNESVLVCWSLTSLCHSNGHIETMPAREINPFTALTRIRSQFLRTQWRAIISEWIRLRLTPLSHRGWPQRECNQVFQKKVIISGTTCGTHHEPLIYQYCGEVLFLLNWLKVIWTRHVSSLSTTRNYTLLSVRLWTLFQVVALYTHHIQSVIVTENPHYLYVNITQTSPAQSLLFTESLHTIIIYIIILNRNTVWLYVYMYTSPETRITSKPWPTTAHNICFMENINYHAQPCNSLITRNKSLWHGSDWYVVQQSKHTDIDAGADGSKW